MADVVFITLTIVFFTVCVAYVRGLDRFVRAAEQIEEGTGEQTS